MINPPATKKARIEQEKDIGDATAATTTTTTTEESSGRTSSVAAAVKKRRWSSIVSKDLVANIATFLDIEDVWCLIQTTSSREQYQEIKRAYLKFNFKFLRLFVQRSERLMVRILNLIRFRISAWLEVNSDWKQMYDNPEQHGILTSENKNDFDDIFNDIYNSVFFSTKITTYLVEHRDVDINQVNADDDTTPLMRAMVCSDLSIIEYVLSIKTIDVNKVIDVHQGTVLLHFAMFTADVNPEKLRLVLSHPTSNANVQTVNGITPLHLLCLCLDRERDGTSSIIWKAKMLLDYGADVNVRDGMVGQH